MDAGSDYEVILVDNASSDDSIAVATDAYPGCVVVRNARNEGFAKACNQGALLATSPYLLFLNSDVALSEGCLESLLRVAEDDSRVVAWQPTLLHGDGRPEPRFSLFTGSGFLWHVPASEWTQDHSSAEAFSLKGACLLVRRIAFENVGGFDEDFFAYFEESDLCWRFHLRGWAVMYVPQPEAIHLGGATTTRIFTPDYVDYMSFRNRISSIVINGGPMLVAKVLPVHLFLCVGTAVAFLLTGKWRHSLSILRAIGSNLVALPTLVKKRRRAQALRRVPDASFIPRLSIRMTQRRGMTLLYQYITGRTAMHRAGQAKAR